MAKQPETANKVCTTTDMYTVTSADTQMNAAINKARKTIGEFDRALHSQNPAYSDFAVKKKYKTAGGGEHIWIAVASLAGGNYRGMVNNDAEETTEVKYGDTVTVNRAEITDWMYLDNNTLRGGYTIREIRNRLNRKEKIKMDEELGFKIDD